MLVFSKALVPSQKVQVLLGQSFDNETFYAYDVLTLSDMYDTICGDLNSKENLTDFVEQIQEVTNIISFGLKAVGLVFPEKPKIQNLNILKKITQAFSSQYLFYGDINSIEKFELKTLKSFPIKAVVDKTITTIRFDLQLDCRLTITLGDDPRKSHKQALLDQKQRIMSQRLLFNGNLLQNESQVLSQALPSENQFRVQILEEQCERQGVDKCLYGTVPLAVYANQNATITQIKQLLYADLEDQLNLRIQQEEPDQEAYILQRVEVEFEQVPFAFQTFKEYDKKVEEYRSLMDGVLNNLHSYKIKDQRVQDSAPQTQPKSVIKKNNDIDLPEPPAHKENSQQCNVSEKSTKEPQSQKMSELYFLGLIFLILSIWFGMKNI